MSHHPRRHNLNPTSMTALTTTIVRSVGLFLAVLAASQQFVTARHAAGSENDRHSLITTNLRGRHGVSAVRLPQTDAVEADSVATATARTLQEASASTISLSPLSIETSPPAEDALSIVVGSDATFRVTLTLPVGRRMTASKDVSIEDDNQEIINERELRSSRNDLACRRRGGLFNKPAAEEEDVEEEEEEEEEEETADTSLFRPAAASPPGRVTGRRRGDRTEVISAVIFITENPSGERIREDGALEAGGGADDSSVQQYSCTMAGLNAVGTWRTMVMVRTRWVRTRGGRRATTEESIDDAVDEDLNGHRRLAVLTTEWVTYEVTEAPVGPTALPSSIPSSIPTPIESASPSTSSMPTVADSDRPSAGPSGEPSVSVPPSHQPSAEPTTSTGPSDSPSSRPSLSVLSSSNPSAFSTMSSRPSTLSSNPPSISIRPTQLSSSPPSISMRPSASPSGIPSLSQLPSSSPSQCRSHDDCSDDFDCTIDTCVDGMCNHEANHTACDDGNFCTQDSCSVDTGCLFASGPMDHQPCDDKNLFTNGDVCESGVCAGTHRPSVAPSARPSTSPTSSIMPSDGPTMPPSSFPSSIPSVSSQPSRIPSQTPTSSLAPTSETICDISLSVTNLDDPSPTAASSGSDSVNIWQWGFFEDGDRKPLYTADYNNGGSDLTFWGNESSLDYSMIHFYKNIPLPEDLQQGCDVPAERLPMEFCFSTKWTYWVGNSTDGSDPSVVYDQPTTFTNEGGPSQIQGIEFSASRWECGYRNEIAMQWENVAEGTWRYWYPTNYTWIALPDSCGITEDMAQPAYDTEHTFELCAIIDGKNINYKTMRLNDAIIDLETCMAHIDVPILFDDNAATLLAGAIQLDGTEVNHPFRVFANDMNLEYKCPEEPSSSPSEAPSLSLLPSDSPSSSPTQCQVDTDCTDSLTCSIDTCVDGFCRNEPNTTAAVIDENFNEATCYLHHGWRRTCNEWFSDGGSVDVVSSNGGTYFRSFDRTKPYNGPKIEIHPKVDCIANNTRYELYARVRLVKPGGTSNCTMGLIEKCPGLTFQYRKSPDGAWDYKSIIDKTPSASDGEWFEMSAVFDFIDAYPDIDSFDNGRIYIQNPEAGVEIHLDAFRFTAVLPLGHGVIGPERNSEAVELPEPPAPTVKSLLLGGERTDCPHDRAGLLDWHDASTWPESIIPTSGDVILPEGASVVVRSSINGTLGLVTVPETSQLIIAEDARGIEINAHGFNVLGSLVAGSESCRVETPIAITLHGARPNDRTINGTSPTAVPTYKGIAVQGGMISLHGKRYHRTWARLAETIRPGDNTAHLQHIVNWEVGQQVVVVTTAIKDDRSWHQNEARTITAVAADPGGIGSIITFDEPLWNTHIANLHYQGEVGLLSRTIVIQGSEADSQDDDDIDDGTYQDMTRRYTVRQDRSAPNPSKNLRGFGGHVMIMNEGKGYVEGVELYRMGQTNFLGRYPMHFHLLGNSCEGCYFRESSIHKSFYRCISIHATHNLTVTENVGYDVTGYCYYLEDGVEEDNTISFNLGAHIHFLGQAPFGGGQQVTCSNPGVDCSGLNVQSVDRILPADSTASAFYITNVHNNIIGNVASGGWAGFAFPILQEPIGASHTDTFRPSAVTGKILDGNTAHSTGGWWGHAAAFYFGGQLFYENGLLKYDPGRGDGSSGRNRRVPCLVDKCATTGDCDSTCREDEWAYIRMTNTKAYQTAGVGLNSWSGRMEIVGIEAHDVGLSLEALEPGFWIDSLVATCRTGEVLAMPIAAAWNVRGDGFVWYDTGQEHIMTNATFRNCGYRSSLDNPYDQYDSSPTRGCYKDPYVGCSSGSSVFGSLAHSDEFNPELMQATKGIAFDNCGRRFKLVDFRESGKDDPSIVPSSISGRIQNWFDIDGSLIGTNEPTIAASGEPDAASWWTIEDSVIQDTQGPMVFILQNNGPARGLGHINLEWDHRPNDPITNEAVSIHKRIGQPYGDCSNGNSFNSTAYTPCATRGYIKHIGPYFDGDRGLPVAAKAEVAGMIGGFGWLFALDYGAPVELKINSIEVLDETPLLLSVQYPLGTIITVSGSIPLPSRAAVWSRDTSCRSFSHYFDDATGLLTLRVVGADRYFSRGNVTLPRGGGVVYISADCDSSDGIHCDDPITPILIDPCPSGYTQTAYDNCCSTANASICRDVSEIYAVNATEASTANGTNLLSDPSFEGFCDGGKPWVKSGATTVFSYDDTEFFSGSRSAKVSNRPYSYTGIRQDVTQYIAPGQAYRISACMKLVSEDDIRVAVKVSARTDRPVEYKTDGTVLRGDTDYYGYWADTSNTTHWTCLSDTFTVSTEWTIIEANIYAETQGDSLADFYIDDVSLSLVE